MDTRVLVVDDHSLIRKGIKLLLQNHLNITNVGEAANCSALMTELQKKTYTHLILDLMLSDGTSLEVIPNIQNLYPSVKIMVFSMLNHEVYGEALKQYGIYHFLHKTSDEYTTVRFIDDFLNNRSTGNKDTAPAEMDKNPFVLLSARELEVLHYMFEGYGTKEISNILNLRMSTVSTVKGRIFDKTQTKNLKDLMQLGALYNINYM